MNQQKIVVAITGASGAIYAKVLLDKLLLLQSQWKEIGIVMSDNAKQVWEMELEEDSYRNYPFKEYAKTDFTAPFASGSAKFTTMFVAPCSMGMLGRVAAGISDDLITRAADVMLKERRKLLLMIRETPYNLIHIKNMETVTLAGGTICPATPSFYSKPTTPASIASTVIDRMLDIAGFDLECFRWGEK